MAKKVAKKVITKEFKKTWKRPFIINNVQLETEMGGKIDFQGKGTHRAMNKYTLKNLIGLLQDELKSRK